MSDPQVLHTLRRKRADIENTIEIYEKRLVHARRDLEHVNATIHLFEAATSTDSVKVYHDIHRLFRRGELTTLCKTALAEQGPMDTRRLSHHIMTVKGFNKADNELRKAIAYRIVQALRLQHKRGTIVSEGKQNGVRVWRLPT